MALQALYRKWRPRSFEDVVGQEHIVRTLRNAITSGRIHHAYLFTGPRGTGKTTTARLLAKAVNCLAPEAQRPCNQCAMCQAVNEGRLLDLIEIDAASNTGVDDVRELRERVGFRPNEARYKVYVIDEVHMLSIPAFNALLKTLEEPPPHAVFVLATTEVQKIPATVLSRCQRFDFHRIPLSEIVGRLGRITSEEGIAADHEALTLIARQATGSMRDAESLLDQLASYGESGITVADVRAALGIGANEAVMQVLDALLSSDIAAGMAVINSTVDSGVDPRRFARQIVEHLRALLLIRLGSDAMPPYVPEEMRPRIEAQAATFAPRGLARALRLFNDAATDSGGAWQPQLLLEMALVEAVLPVEPERSLPRSREGSAQAPSQVVTPFVQPAAPASARVPSPSPSTAAQPERVREIAPAYSNPIPVEGPLTPEVVRSRWPELLEALRRRNLPLEALMRSCEPVAVEGEVVVLGFEYDLHRSRVEEEQNKRDVEDVLSIVIGRRCRVRCALAKRVGPGDPSQPAGGMPVGEQHVASPEPVPVDDPLIRAAMDLGAQIVHRQE